MKRSKTIRPEAPIAHSPDQAARPIGKRRQPAFDLREPASVGSNPSGRIASTDRIARKVYRARSRTRPGDSPTSRTAQDSRPRRPARAASSRQRHPQRRPTEQVRALHGQPAEHRHAARANSPRNVRGGNAPVLNSTIRSSRSGIRSIAPRPIAPPQSCATSVTRSSCSCSNERAQILDVIVQASRTAAAYRSARSRDDPAHAAIIGHAAPRSIAANETTTWDCRERTATSSRLQRHSHAGRAFVEIVHPARRHIHPMRLKRIKPPPVGGFFACSSMSWRILVRRDLDARYYV